MPAIRMAFAGSSSDAKPNDRLPIITETHEPLCRRKKCLVKKSNLKTTYAIQRTQSLTNGYFGDYMGSDSPPAHWKQTNVCIIIQLHFTPSAVLARAPLSSLLKLSPNRMSVKLAVMLQMASSAFSESSSSIVNGNGLEIQILLHIKL